MVETEKKWYVLRAISGKEAKVKEYLEAEINNGLLANVFQVLIPTEKVIQNNNGKKIVKGLADMKMRLSECAFADACGAFGPQIGEKVLQKVYEKYGTLIVTKDQLETVDGFGNARIEQYMQYLSGWEWIYNFAIHSLHISFIKPNTEVKNAELNGQIICFTGIRDKEFAKYLLEKGADVSDNWKSTTNLLVAKDPNGNSIKIKKAKEKGITILSLEEAYVHFIYKR